MQENNAPENIELGLKPLWNKLQSWYDAGIQLLPNILIAIVVIVIGMFLTRSLKSTFDRIARKLVKSAAVANLISSALTVLLVLAVLFLVLSVLGLSTAVSTLLGGAGVVGLAIGLAFQDPILNLFSGIVISTRDFFRIGDLIEIDGYFGKIKQVTLRSTMLETLQGQEIVIPNKIVAQSPMKNYTTLNHRRVDVSCGVSYGENLEQVKELTLNAIRDNVPHDKKKDVQLFFTEFGDSSINYTLRFWMADKKTTQGDYLAAQSAAMIAIKKAYDANDIMIPFPIRTLDFGIKGGEKLTDLYPDFNSERDLT